MLLRGRREGGGVVGHGANGARQFHARSDAPSEAAEPADRRVPAASFVGHRDHVTVKSLFEQKVYLDHQAAVVAAVPPVSWRQ